MRHTLIHICTKINWLSEGPDPQPSCQLYPSYKCCQSSKTWGESSPEAQDIQAGRSADTKLKYSHYLQNKYDGRVVRWFQIIMRSLPGKHHSLCQSGPVRNASNPHISQTIIIHQHLNLLRVLINTHRSHWFSTESMSADHFWNKVPDLFYWTDSHENLMNAVVTLDLYVYAQIHNQWSLI